MKRQEHRRIIQTPIPGVVQAQRHRLKNPVSDNPVNLPNGTNVRKPIVLNELLDVRSRRIFLRPNLSEEERRSEMGREQTAPDPGGALRESSYVLPGQAFQKLERRQPIAGSGGLSGQAIRMC